MRSPIQFRFSLRGLLTFCLGTALLVANFAPRHHPELKVDAATLNRVDHSWGGFTDETFTDVITKGWPATAYLSHRNPFAHITAALTGKPVETNESYVDERGVAINAFVAAMALIICYLFPIAISSARHGRTIPLQ